MCLMLTPLPGKTVTISTYIGSVGFDLTGLVFRKFLWLNGDGNIFKVCNAAS